MEILRNFKNKDSILRDYWCRIQKPDITPTNLHSTPLSPKPPPLPQTLPILPESICPARINPVKSANNSEIL